MFVRKLVPGLAATALATCAAGGFKQMSAGVDAVLNEQVERYERYVDTGKP